MSKLFNYTNSILLTLVIACFLTSCKQDSKEVNTADQTNQKKTLTTEQQRQQTKQVRLEKQPVQQVKKPQTQQRAQYPTEPKVPGGKVNWMTFEEVEKAMKKEKKKVFVDMYTDWCGWCKRYDKTTFADKRVADYVNENFYAIKFDAQEPEDIMLAGQKYANPNFDHSRPKRARNATHQLAQKYGARSYPTVLFLDNQFNLIQAATGYRTADKFLPLLAQINK